MNRIRELRTARGMTQQELGKQLNCAKTAISKYELEQLGIDAKTINTLCSVFDCTADYLLCRSSMKNPEFTEAEYALVSAYRAASKDARDVVDITLKPWSQAKEKNSK